MRLFAAIFVLLFAAFYTTLFESQANASNIGTVRATVSENETLELEAPDNSVFVGVQFASYGTPNDYTVDPSCNADNSIALVASAFMGKSHSTISASNDVFGDPCGGTYKRLSVILIYANTSQIIMNTVSVTCIKAGADPITASVRVMLQSKDQLPDMAQSYCKWRGYDSPSSYSMGDLSWTAPVVQPSPSPSPSETPTSTVDGETVSVSVPQDTSLVTTQETSTLTAGQDQTPTNSSDPSPTPAPSQDPAIEPQQLSPSQEDTQTAQSPSEPVQPSTSPLPSDSQSVVVQQPDPSPAPAPAPVAAPDPAPQTQPDEPSTADAADPAAADPNAAADAPAAAADPTGTDAPAPAPTSDPTPASGDTSNPVSDPTPAQQTDAGTPAVVADPQPAPAPSTDPTTDSSATPGLVADNPSSLPDSIPKLPDESSLVPHVQVDQPGVENGGIAFFGTKTQPQVIGEDGKLTPPPPPPGSGLPIPPDAITLSDTFIGQPGGTTFNAPDVAVPVIETPVTGALAAVPGVQALNHAFVAMANIGNDMSPITRKKAKKILVLTTVIAAVRRRFGN